MSFDIACKAFMRSLSRDNGGAFRIFLSDDQLDALFISNELRGAIKQYGILEWAAPNLNFLQDWIDAKDGVITAEWDDERHLIMSSEGGFYAKDEKRGGKYIYAKNFTDLILIMDAYECLIDATILIDEFAFIENRLSENDVAVFERKLLAIDAEIAFSEYSFWKWQISMHRNSVQRDWFIAGRCG